MNTKYLRAFIKEVRTGNLVIGSLHCAGDDKTGWFCGCWDPGHCDAEYKNIKEIWNIYKDEYIDKVDKK